MDQRVSEGEMKFNKTKEERRKRVNRIKTVIIMIGLILILLPTIFCIVLGVKVSRLQRQVNDLLQYGNNNEISMNRTDDYDNYAYAAQIPSRNTNAVIGQTGNSEDKINSSDVTKEDQPKSDSSGSGKETDPNPLTALDIEDKSNQDTSDKADPADNMTEQEDQNKSDNEKNLSATNTGKSDKKDTRVNSKENKEKNEQKDEISSLNTGKYEGKKVYLTFDDGPSNYTDDILDLLAKYHVKATFFVIGKTDKNSLAMYQRIVKEGHTLGMHSYSHIYKQIYNSVEDFDKDFTKLWNLLYDTTGYKPSIYRFPGGSANLVSKIGMDEFVSYLNKKSVVYYDWNVDNGDETGVDYTKDQLVKNVLDGVAQKRTPIVLMHDSNEHKTTLDSLSDIIEELVSGGAQILPIDDSVTPIQQIKADSVK